jgi:hypothetical protein
MADLGKPWRSPRQRVTPLQELFDEIDALSRKRVYKQVPNEPV